MLTHVRALIVDDAPAESARVATGLEARGISVEHLRVASVRGLARALESRSWDVVIAEHDARRLNAASVVSAVKARGLGTPVIVAKSAGVEESRGNVEIIDDDAALDDLSRTIVRAIEGSDIESGAKGADADITNLFELSPDLLCVADDEGHFMMLNPAWEKALSITRRELLSRPYLEYVHPDDREMTQQAAENALAGRQLAAFENRFRTADGTHRWFRWHVASSPSQNRIYAIGRDITTQKRRVRRTEISLARVLEAAGEGICLLDHEGNIRFMNETGTRILGRDLEDVIARGFHGTVHPSHAEGPGSREECALWTTIRQRQRSRADADIFQVGEDSVRPVEYTYTPIDENGEYSGAVIVFRDVTEKARAEFETGTIHRLTRTIAEARDLDTALGETLEVLRQITGAEVAEAWIAGPPRSKIRLNPSWAGDRSRFQEFRRTSEAIDFDPHTCIPGYVWRSGAPVWIDLRDDLRSLARAPAPPRAGLRTAFAVPAISTDHVVAVLAFFSSVETRTKPATADLVSSIATQVGTLIERRQIESELRESETRLRRLAETAPAIVFRYRLTPDIGFEYVSGTATEILGHAPAAHYADPRLWETLVEGTDLATIRRLLRGEVGNWDTVRITRADGSTAVLEINALRVEDDDGGLVAIEGIAHDASHRIHAERTLREQRDHLKKLASDLEAANEELEAFSYTVSHDLRAPLRGIDYFSEALWQEYGSELPGEGVEYLKRVRAEARHLTDLVNDLLELSRVSRAPLRREAIDVSALAREIVDAQVARVPERDVVATVEPGLTTSADSHLLRIALTNLIENAVKYSKNTEHARIEVGAATTEEGPAFFVRDNGTGFDMAHADRLFRPFQRLHAAQDYEGTGIGLATVNRIVRLHGGRIWADSHPGRGATFYFSL